MYDAIAFVCVFFFIGKIALILISSVNPISAKEMNLFTMGLFFRIILTYAYWAFSLTGPADAKMYFRFAQQVKFSVQSLFLQPGTESVRHFTALIYPLIRIFENQYLMTYIPFSLLGFLGSILFYTVMKPLYLNRKKKRELYILTFFIPNLIFWTSNIGKDSLVFFGLMLVLYGSQQKKSSIKQLLSIALGCVVVYYARPHLIIFLMIGFGAGLYLEKSKFSFSNIAIFAVIILAFLVLHQRIFKIAGVNLDENAEQSSMYDSDGGGGAGVGGYLNAGVDRLDRSAGSLSAGGSATGPRKFNPIKAPWYIVEFICSPFIWQARSPLHLGSALESLIYQLMLVYLLLNWKFFGKQELIKYKFSLLIYILVVGVLLGMAQTNFGLIIRQKCMVLPFLFFNYSSIRQYKKELKNAKKIKAKPSVGI